MISFGQFLKLPLNFLTRASHLFPGLQCSRWQKKADDLSQESSPDPHLLVQLLCFLGHWCLLCICHWSDGTEWDQQGSGQLCSVSFCSGQPDWKDCFWTTLQPEMHQQLEHHQHYFTLLRTGICILHHVSSFILFNFLKERFSDFLPIQLQRKWRGKFKNLFILFLIFSCLEYYHFMLASIITGFMTAAVMSLESVVLG